MIKDLTITKPAARSWVSFHHSMSKAEMRQKWDKYTTEAKLRTCIGPDPQDREHWVAGGYVFGVKDGEIKNVWPYRAHLYQP